MADRDVADQHDIDLDAVWSDVWNPESNAWAPSGDPFPQYGQDSPLSAYQSHGDVAVADPMSEMYGHPGQGTVPSAGMNLLTDVKSPGASPPPRTIIEHDVHVTETGSEIARVRQTVVSGTTPINLLEEQPYRKRALVRVIGGAGATSQTFSGSGAAGTQVSIPAGQTWNIQNISFLYNTSAAVGNRNVRVRLVDAAGRTVYETSASVNQGPSLTNDYSAGVGLPNNALGTTPIDVTMPLPNISVVGGGQAKIQVFADGGDAGDSVTVGTVYFNLTGSGSVFISPRAEGGAAAASASWFRLSAGDPPIELKTQSGIDVVGDGSNQTLHIYEELVRNGEQPLTGIV